MAAQRGGFPEDAFTRLAQVEPGNYWFEARNHLIVWALRRYFPQAASFLEIGCGTGFVLQAVHTHLPDLALTASDFMDNGLAIARARVPSATFTTLDARGLVAREAFDVIGAFDVLEHIEEDGLVLERMHAAVRTGGGIVVTVPQHRWLWSRADEVAHHVRRYRRSELVERVRRAGFEVTRVTSFVSVLLPLMALSRWLDARRTQPFDGREFEVSRATNGALLALLAIERRLIQFGLSWPAGGSLLLVARKATGKQ